MRWLGLPNAAGALQVKAYSFDVFDTCLARRHLRPDDLIHSLAAIMLGARRGHGEFGYEEIRELAAARKEAERDARRRHQNEDILLSDIYRSFSSLGRWGIDPGEMQRAEIELEEQSVRPIRAMGNRIERLRRAGKRIIFISDMYLPASEIRGMLLKHGMARSDEPLYVSGELGITKRSGRLFDHVLARERLQPQELLHVGDSVVGDLLAARRRRVRSTLYADALPNRFEEAVRDGSPDDPTAAARIAGLCRITRLSLVAEQRLASGALALAADIIAPLLTGFVLWTLQEARRQGVTRLYFVARDGQVLLDIARRLCVSDTGPELRYLYGSRQAWLLPSVFEVTRDDLEFVLLAGQSSAPRHCLRRLQIEPEEISSVLVRHGFEPLSWDRQLPPEEKDRLWHVLEEPNVAQLILKNANLARDAALAYLRQEGLLQDDRWALVDVGWTLRAQSALKKLLAAAGQTHIAGYYLGMSKARFSSPQYGKASGWLVEEAEAEAATEGASTIFENKGLIDQVFTIADHGTTRGYQRANGAIIPDLMAVTSSPQQDAFRAMVREAVEDFAESVAADDYLQTRPQEFRSATRRATRLYLAHPRRRDVEAVTWAHISDDPNESRSAQLVRPLSPVLALGIAVNVLSRLRSMNQSESQTVPIFRKDLDWGFSWIEGSLAITRGWGRPALWSLQRIRRVARRRRILGVKAVSALHRTCGETSTWRRISR